MHRRWPPRLLALALAAQGAAAARPRHAAARAAGAAVVRAEEAGAAAAGAAAQGGAAGEALGAAGRAPGAAEEHRGAGEGGEVLGIIVSGSSGKLQRSRDSRGRADHRRHHHPARRGGRAHGTHGPHAPAQAPAAPGPAAAPAAEAAAGPLGAPGAQQGRPKDSAEPLVAAACWLSDVACGCGSCAWRARWLPACEERASRGGAGTRRCGEEAASDVSPGPLQDFPVFFLVAVAAPIIALGGAAALSSAIGVGKGYCVGDARKLGLSRAELEERISAATRLSDQQRQALLDRFCGCTSALDVLRAEAAEDECAVLAPKPF